MTILYSVLLVLAVVILALVLYTLFLARNAEAQVPQAGQIQAVVGGAIHYVEMGPKDAPPIVLIHGISGQLQHFTYGVAELLAADFHVFAIDRPGNGYSERIEDDSASLPEQARMIGEFMAARGIERAVVAGHSLGGAVTLALALDRPDQVAAMALISPATQNQDSVDAVFKGLEIRSPLMRRLLAYTIAGPMGNATKGQVLAHAFAPETPVPDFMSRAAAVLGLRPKAYVTACCDLVTLEKAMPEQVARYDTLSVPGGVLYGDADPLLDPELHGKSMIAHGLSYEELPGRGHMLPITAPRECADFIRRIAAMA